jgi:quinol monooxygenase YgiN
MTNQAETVRALARITAQPDKVEELITVLLHLVEETRKENGCISYQLLQNKADPRDFTVIEEWASDSVIDTHLASAHMQEAFSKAAPLLASEPDIRRYRLLDKDQDD